MQSAVRSRFALLSIMLGLAGAPPQCLAQTDREEKQAARSQAWVSAGTIAGYDSHIYSLAFGPGPILVSGDAKFVRVWDVETKLEHSFYKPPAQYATAITAITYSPSDDWVSFRGPHDYHLAFGQKWIKDGRLLTMGWAREEIRLRLWR